MEVLRGRSAAAAQRILATLGSEVIHIPRSGDIQSRRKFLPCRLRTRDRPKDSTPARTRIAIVIVRLLGRPRANGDAIAANQANSRLSTCRAIAKKYPEIDPDELLRNLIASTPGDEGKWFATARSLKRFDLAAELAWASPCDPATLTRAARDHLDDRPAFATQAARAALYWIAAGYGHELAAADAQEAYRLALDGAQRAGQEEQVRQWLRQLLASDTASARWLRQALGMPPA